MASGQTPQSRLSTLQARIRPELEQRAREDSATNMWFDAPQGRFGDQPFDPSVHGDDVRALEELAGEFATAGDGPGHAAALLLLAGVRLERGELSTATDLLATVREAGGGADPLIPALEEAVARETSTAKLPDLPSRPNLRVVPNQTARRPIFNDPVEKRSGSAGPKSRSRGGWDAPVSGAAGGDPNVMRSLRLFGFPFHIHFSYLLLVAYFLYTGLSGAFDPGFAIEYTVAQLLILTLSIVCHELGHAFAYRLAHAGASILLYAGGGLTFGTPSGRLRTRQWVVVSLAGITVNFALAAIADLLLRSTGADPGDHGVGMLLWLVRILNLFLGVFNALPLYPLDGGNTVLAMAKRFLPRMAIRFTMTVSFATAALVAVWALSSGSLILLSIVVWVVIATAQLPRRDGRVV